MSCVKCEKCQKYLAEEWLKKEGYCNNIIKNLQSEVERLEKVDKTHHKHIIKLIDENKNSEETIVRLHDEINQLKLSKSN